MASTDYIFEKATIAVECLAGGGTFEERLRNAYISALDRLDSRDASAELADDLNWVLLRCQHYLIPGTGMKAVSEDDRRMIVEKLVWLLIKSARVTA